MLYFQWLILPLYSLIIIIAMVTVLMENRQPAKALAWLMVLALVPVAGLVLYIFFGQNISKRHRQLMRERSLYGKLAKNKTHNDVVNADGQIELPLKANEESGTIGDHLPLIRLFSHQEWAHIYKHNEVDVYTSGKDFFPDFIACLKAANHHIHLLTYIIDDDNLGNEVADVLMEKARSGVEVRLIYDDVGCWRTPNRFFRRMTDAGVNVRPFMPVHFPMLTSKVNYRNHRKICIVDGVEGFIGGMNIADRYVSGTKRFGWRDTHLRLRGGAVRGMQHVFLADWHFVSREQIVANDYFPRIPADVSNSCMAQVVTSSPTSTAPDIMQGYVSIIQQAKQYVYIETPYFMPTETVLFALRTAALSGVDVRLMVPYHSDARFPEWASRSYVMQVLDVGVKVYFYKAAFNHTKMLISDDSLCTCGSTNVDFRSFENNFEANIFFYDRNMAQRMKQVFLEDLRRSVLINDVKVISKRPFINRLWESIVRLFAPLL